MRDVGGSLLGMGGITHDPAFAQILAADLELRLDQEDAPRQRRCQCEYRRQHELERDEAHVDDDGADRLADVGGGEVARVDALAGDDPRIGCQARIELAVSDVDGVHAPCAAFQEHLGEPAGRGANVERDDAVGRKAERVERRHQLQGGARDVRRRGVIDGDGRVARHGQRRAGRGLAFDGHPAAQDGVAGSRPGGHETALNQRHVEADAIGVAAHARGSLQGRGRKRPAGGYDTAMPTRRLILASATTGSSS